MGEPAQGIEHTHSVRNRVRLCTHTLPFILNLPPSYYKMRRGVILLAYVAAVVGKEDWTGRQKDVRDYSDADMHKLLEEWDKDEEPIPPDELPDGHPDKPRPPLDITKIKNINDPDEIMKISKKGQTVMLFVKVSEFNGDRDEVGELTSLWQTGLMNNHVSSERFRIEDDRVMFLFHDGADAWEAKDFFIEQERCEEVQLEQKTYHGKYVNSQKPKEEKKEKKEKKKKKAKKIKAEEEL